MPIPTMRSIARGFCLLTLLVATVAFGGGTHYRRCHLSGGHVGHCVLSSREKAVVLRNGAYRECDVINGELHSCSGWYNGKAAVLQGGTYRTCSITKGQANACGTSFSGDAIVETDQL